LDIYPATLSKKINVVKFEYEKKYKLFLLVYKKEEKKQIPNAFEIK